MSLVTLDGSGNLQQQICHALRHAISTGALAANSRLQPSRVFAEQYGVSRNTVIAAYDQLCAEGYLVTRRGAGTFVADVYAKAAEEIQDSQNNKTIAGDSADNLPEPNWSTLAQRLNQEVPQPLLSRPARVKLRYDFLYGEPGYADLPIDKWARTMGRRARDLTENQLGYGPLAGLPELRKQLADYLRRARGVDCNWQQIFIVQGTQEAIDLSVRAFIDKDDCAVLEEPHYRGFKRCLLAAGAKLKTIAVDADGIIAEKLSGIKNARMIFVTPSHQFPFGSVMTLARRQQLLDWANQNSAVVVEDDYDGEFRYEGRPIPSLQSLDRHGSVIYLGTTSKMLFPSLRLGWMVVPPHMVNGFERLKSLTDGSVSIVEQLALSEFIANGQLDRHIHKVRRSHRQRRAVLLEAIEQAFADTVEVVGTDAGIHVLLRIQGLPMQHTEALVAEAARQEVGVYPTAQYYTRPPQHCELLLGYASLTPGQIRIGVKRLASVVQSMRATLANAS